MPSTFVGSGQYHNSVGGVGAISYTATTGNSLILVASANVATSGLTPSDGYNTYQFLGNIQTNPSLGMWLAPVTTGGALTIGLSGAGTYAMYVEERTETLTYITGSFQGQQQGAPGVGANNITTGTSPNATSVPAVAFAFSFDSQTLFGGTNVGPAVGTGAAYTSRAVGWLSTGTGTHDSALAEDIRVLFTGSQAMTFGSVSGNQYDTFLTIGAMFAEAPQPGWTRNSVGTLVQGFNTSLSPTITGQSVGDLLILYAAENMAAQNGDTPPTVSGYTQLNTGNKNQGIYGRIATGTSADNPTVPAWSSGQEAYAFIVDYTCAPGVLPLSNIVFGVNENVNSTENNITYNGIAITQANTLVIAVGQRGKSATTDSNTFSTIGSNGGNFNIAYQFNHSGNFYELAYNDWIQSTATNVVTGVQQSTPSSEATNIGYDTQIIVLLSSSIPVPSPGPMPRQIYIMP